MKQILITITDEQMIMKSEGLSKIELIGALTFYRDQSMIEALENKKPKKIKK
jgi:hypothetical protein